MVSIKTMEHFRLNYKRTINPEDSTAHFETSLIFIHLKLHHLLGFFSTLFSITHYSIFHLVKLGNNVLLKDIQAAFLNSGQVLRAGLPCFPLLPEAQQRLSTSPGSLSTRHRERTLQKTCL